MNKTKPSEPQTAPLETPQPSATTKRYDDAFKRAAVENWIKSGKRGTQIAAELGVSYPSLKDWKRRYVGDATPVRADLAAENRALKIELARVREQRDILKKRGASSPNHRRPVSVHRKHESPTFHRAAVRHAGGEGFRLLRLGQGPGQSARRPGCHAGG
jgi:transposase-like protein